MERLVLGPYECAALNPKLVYGRMTGWGQDGPLANPAGHDNNYIALAGVLSCIGPTGGPPVPPLNLVRDYGGGGIYLALGMVCCLLESSRYGMGDVVDAAMSACASSLATALFAHAFGDPWHNPPGMETDE